MERNVDVLVIGAGPAGIISAVTARKYYPEKSISVMKSIDKGVVPCGIPYMFASLKDPEENKLGNAALDKNNIDVIVDEAIEIDRNQKTVFRNLPRTYHLCPNTSLTVFTKSIVSTGLSQ